MNEWMNEWMNVCIYVELYCVLLYTQSALQSCAGGVSPQPPPVCSFHLDDATAATGHRGYNPTLYEKCHGHFLMTTESQDLGLTSHPKDGDVLQYSVPVTILGR